jgi:hypothetical protein
LPVNPRGIVRPHDDHCSARRVRRIRAADSSDTAALRESDGAQRWPDDAAPAPRKKKGRCSCSSATAPRDITQGWGAGFASSSPWLAAGEGFGSGQAPNGGTSQDASSSLTIPTTPPRGWSL